jgi:endonuclease-8
MPVMEVLLPRQAARHRPLLALGPDLLGLTVGRDGPAPLPEPDWATVQARAREQPTRPLVDLLLDQRVACGLGNVYKSELLFLHGLHPWAPVGSIAAPVLDAVYKQGRRLLIANTRRGRRTTRGDGRSGALWVYGRAGSPCLRCGEPVQHDAGTGPVPRGTDWCPRCQRPEAPTATA